MSYTFSMSPRRYGTVRHPETGELIPLSEAYQTVDFHDEDYPRRALMSGHELVYIDPEDGMLVIERLDGTISRQDPQEGLAEAEEFLRRSAGPGDPNPA